MADICKIFISSVFGDSFKDSFCEERESLKYKINNGDEYFKDISLDYGSADASSGSYDKSLERIAEADIIVLFIGTRYGSKNREKANGISLTHEEYRKAYELDKKILIYEFPRDKEHVDSKDIKCFLDEIIKKDKYTIGEIVKKDNYLEIYDYKSNKIDKEPEESLRKRYLEDLTARIYIDLIKAKQSVQALPKFIEKFKYEDKERKYISRNDFKKLNNIENFLTEEDIFSQLLKDNKYGIFICGEGGIGKTMLSDELANRFLKESSWEVLIIKEKFEELSNLNSYYKSNKNYCIYLDDSNFKFSKEDLDKHIKDNKNKNTKNIIIILNSRNSYDNIDDFKDDNKFISIINSSQYEQNYIDFVSKKMLENDGVKFEKSKSIEHWKPSYIKYFLDNGGIENLLDNTDFKDFLKKDFEKQFKSKNMDFKKIESKYFYLLANLPLNKDEIRKKYKSEIKDLKDGKWIQDDREIYKATYNDTIIDEILDMYLNLNRFEDIDDFKDEIIEFIKFSIEHNTFMNLLNNFGKLSSKARMRMKDIFKGELLKKDKFEDIISSNQKSFKNSSILKELDKIEILKEYNLLPSKTDKAYALFLSRTASQIKTEEDINKFEKYFKEWLSHNDENSLRFLYSNEIASYFICDIYDYYKKYNKILENFDINFYTEKYVEKFKGNEKVSFIFQRYIEFNKNIKNIEESIIKYIKEFYDKDNVSYVIQAYLDNKGDIKNIEESIVKYIKEFYTKEDTNYIIQKYLDNEGNIKNIEESIIKYIKEFYTKEDSYYVIQKYLDNGGNIEILFDEINNIFIYEKYEKYLDLSKKNYDALIKKYDVYFNDFIKNYNFNIEKDDLKNYILTFLRIKEKNILSDKAEEKFNKEILNYIKEADITSEYLDISKKFFKKDDEIQSNIQILVHNLSKKELEIFLEEFDNLLKLVNLNVIGAQYASKEGDEIYSNAKILLITIISVVILLSVIIGSFITNSIVISLNDLQQVLFSFFAFLN
ncbi:DUF4062 domain-containing protein, partial [Aliarcobacter butzleri]|uniref:DUF4062 domain-containing protein n=1 Tax=Aliarcobacter butzleri TaxID=28197 RepID=UPI00263F765E